MEIEFRSLLYILIGKINSQVEDAQIGSLKY